MISLVNETILDKMPDMVKGLGLPLSFLKYSTPSSGKNLNDKVIFFVFGRGAPAPSFCVKTVRNYGAKETVARNFHNLEKLNKLTAGSPYADMFAHALYLHDDGENIFSVETVCPGKRVILNDENLKTVVAEYTGFQQYVAKQGRKRIDDIARFAEETVARSGLNEGDKEGLSRFVKTFPFTGLKLPQIVQHGDVTEDNILLSGDKLSIVDCDYVDVTSLPGFDLFGLFYRYSQHEAKALCYKYLPEYFAKIGAAVESDKYNGLLFLYYFSERTLRKRYFLEGMSAERIISDFKKYFS